MKKKMNAREKREEMRAPRMTPEEQAKNEAEETRLFLEYIEKYQTVKEEEDTPVRRQAASSALPILNLEDGMPIVEEAIRRMSMGIQEMRVSGIRAVKLIHGYGSTGTGGKIRIGIRRELSTMKKRKLIRDFIPGENFGPFDETSRKMTERNRAIARDPDYGRSNHGITIVMIV